METSERAIELAERFEAEERARKVAAISGSLTGAGEKYCKSCGDPIAQARRAALPSATRCVECQEHHERNSSGSR
jgi:phage/conjugal plasmid C-4 type zinc finger TraR family protein